MGPAPRRGGEAAHDRPAGDKAPAEKAKADKAPAEKPKPSAPAPSTAPAEPASRKKSEGVTIKGVDDVLIRFAGCCNPLPGEPIVGYITRGPG